MKKSTFALLLVLIPIMFMVLAASCTPKGQPVVSSQTTGSVAADSGSSSLESSQSESQATLSSGTKESSATLASSRAASSSASSHRDRTISEEQDLNNLSTLTEAFGADSGAKGTLYVINHSNFMAELGSEKHIYDGEKFLVSLQGLQNRSKPTIYVSDSHGSVWLNYFRYTKDSMLYGYKKKAIRNMDELINAFKGEIQKLGLVVWDPKQPFTSNIASTVCGVEGYLPVMYDTAADSLYTKLTQTHKIAVKMDLRSKFTGSGKIWGTSLNSNGSAKCDAYLWALEKYLKTGKCSKEYIAYMRDAWPINGKLNAPTYLRENSIYETYLPDQDFLISKKAFFVDLCMFPDDLPNDDKTQPLGLDYQVLCKILKQQYDNNGGAFSQCVGFAPFFEKYTDNVGGKYDNVMSEFVITEVLSAYNIALQADCPGPSSLFNCSVYTHAKTNKTYSQANKRPSSLPKYDPNKKYITFYFGDYDAASWSLSIGASNWQDSARGEFPIAWGFNPNLYERIPQFFDWVHTTATKNDIFVAGDSGAGYIFPPLLEGGNRKHSTLPDGLNAWKTWCTQFYKKFDLTMSPAILIGNTGYPSDRIMRGYSEFSPDGVSVWSYPGSNYGNKVIAGMAILGAPHDYGFMRSMATADCAKVIVNAVQNRNSNLNFYRIGTNICTPKQVYEAYKEARKQNPNIELLDMYTFYAMAKREMQK